MPPRSGAPPAAPPPAALVGRGTCVWVTRMMRRPVCVNHGRPQPPPRASHPPHPIRPHHHPNPCAHTRTQAHVTHAPSSSQSGRTTRHFFCRFSVSANQSGTVARWLGKKGPKVPCVCCCVACAVGVKRLVCGVCALSVFVYWLRTRMSRRAACWKRASISTIVSSACVGGRMGRQTRPHRTRPLRLGLACVHAPGTPSRWSRRASRGSPARARARRRRPSFASLPVDQSGRLPCPVLSCLASGCLYGVCAWGLR